MRYQGGLSPYTNVIPIGNAYPGAGRTLGALATTAYDDVPDMPAETTDNAVLAANGRKVFPAWLALVLILVAFMYTSQRLESGATYANLKLTFHNILSITLAAIIGISVMKAIFLRFRVPGFSDVVLAS